LTSAGLRITDLEGGEQRTVPIRLEPRRPVSVAFSPDGSRLVTASSDGTVRQWDAATGEALVWLPGHSDYVYSLAFSPDGTTLVSSSGDTTLRLWDTEPLRERSQVRRAAEALRPKVQ
jgi:WD40 repeat protein